MTGTDHRWRSFIICAVIATLTILDLTKVNVALPAIQEAVGASSTELQLVVAGYILTFGLALVPAGRLGDQRSRKVLFVVGLSIFTATSVMGGLATDPTILVIARLLQGIGAGIQMPQVMGMLQDLFRGPERGRVFGMFGAIIGLATAVGPTLGGVLVQLGGPEWGWRWIFLLNLPLGILTILATIFFLPGRDKTRPRLPLSMDPVGIGLFGVAVIALMWPFLFTTGSPADDPNRWWSLVLCAVALGILLWWEARYARTGRHPLIPLRLFRIGSFRNSTIISSLYFAAMPSMFLLGTLYLQQGLGYGPVVAGATTITFALVSAVTSWWGGMLVNRHGRLVIVIGLALVIIAAALLAVAVYTVDDGGIPWVFAAIMAIGGAGGGLVISPNQAVMLEDIPVAEGGLAGSVAQLGQRIGNAIGGAVALSIFYSTVAGALHGVHDAAVQAFGLGMIAVIAILGVSFIVGVVDLRRSRQA